MLAELVDHVIGVDPDRDWITLAVLEALGHPQRADHGEDSDAGERLEHRLDAAA